MRSARWFALVMVCGGGLVTGLESRTWGQYTLTVGGANGSVARSPDRATYDSGDVVTLTANPDSCYQFTGWSGDASGTANPTSITMDGNKTVTANFAQIQYKLIVCCSEGDVSEMGYYACGSVVSITACTIPHYHFVNWTASGSVTVTNPNAASTTVTVNGDGTVTAHCVIDTYTLTINATNGSVTASPNKTAYDFDEIVSLTATPDVGYSFSGWSGTASGTSNPTSITMNGNKSVTANFAATALTYTLTVSAAHGSVTVTPDKPSYAYGEIVSLTATPDVGYSFSGWSGAASGTSNPTSITMNGNKSVTANFAATAPTYTLTVSAAHGSVTVTPDKSSYAYGEIVSLTATPDAGYHFSGWSGAASGTSTSTSITMNGNKSVTANFAATAPTYTLTVSAAHGSVTVTPDKSSYAYGEIVSLTATPDAGYHFSGWSGAASGTATSISIMMTGDKSVMASFAAGQVYSFSIGVIDADDPDQFTYRVTTNDTSQRTFVERVTGALPDPNGMILMRVIAGLPGQMTGRFGQCAGGNLWVRFNYLFEAAATTEIVVYLSDWALPLAPGDPLRLQHYVEVGRVLPPPPGRPGAVGSGCYGEFEQWVSETGLDFSAGVYVTLELRGTGSATSAQMRILSGPNAATAEALIDNWSVGVCSGICMDLDWSTVVNVRDYRVLPALCGRSVGQNGSPCLSGAFGSNGFIGRNELVSLDWMLNCAICTEFCGLKTMPVSVTPPPPRPPVATSPLPGSMGVPKGLLLLGKRSPGAVVGLASDLSLLASQDDLLVQDRLYGLQPDLTFAGTYEPAGFANRGNVKLVWSDMARAYLVNSEKGLVDLEGRTVVSPGCWQGVLEPRYGRTAQVYLGVQGQGAGAFGRPVLDAAIRGNYAYVVPVVVVPAWGNAYLAAAKLSLADGRLLRIYDDPDPKITHSVNPDNPNLMGLQELEVDGAGNVYVLNVERRNNSTMLWKYNASASAAPRRVELDALGIVNPVGLCLGKQDAMLYVASGLCDWLDPNAVRVHELATADLTLQKTIRIGGMHYATDIAAQSSDGVLWVAGFGLDTLVKQICTIVDVPRYRPCLARIGPEGQVRVTNLAGRTADLSLPMSLVWTGSR